MWYNGTDKRGPDTMYKPRFKVVFSDERIISPSGLGIVGGMLAKSDFVKRCNRIPVDKYHAQGAPRRMKTAVRRATIKHTA